METHRGAQLHQEFPQDRPLREHASSPEPEAREPDIESIIAVQGLASQYEWTWSVEADSETKERYHWLRDRLPADLKKDGINARILAFEYPSEWYGDPVHTSLEECGQQLLHCIIADRRHTGIRRICAGKRKRPLILVGHSFGGIVIKQALVLASRKLLHYPSSQGSRDEILNYRDILSCTSGIIFLGAPHRGSAISVAAQWKISFGNWVTGARSCADLIHVLELDSGLLSSIQSSFSDLRRAMELSSLRVFCFYEMKEHPVVRRLVVTRESACLDDSVNSGLEANHSGLNKFGRDSDSNYDLVLDAISKACVASTEIVQSRFERRLYNSAGSTPELNSLQRWLSPSEQQVLQYHLKSSFQEGNPSSCQWLLDVQSFTQWRSGKGDTNIYWIRGMPGSGKSVLAAFVVRSLREWLKLHPNESWINGDATSVTQSCSACEKARSRGQVLYFFFGIDKSHESPERFLGTLIHQILTLFQDDTKMQEIALKAYGSYSEFARSDVLYELLKDLLSRSGSAHIIIDGIEENSHYEDCISHIVRLSQEIPERVRLYLSSQTELRVSQTTAAALGHAQIISMSLFNGSDLMAYVSNRATHIIESNPELRPFKDKIKSRLHEGSRGMFQWVKAVSDQIAMEASPDNLSNLLQDLPVELVNTWGRVFLRFRNKPYSIQERIKRLLQWLFVAARPLSAIELKVAISLSGNDSDVPNWDAQVYGDLPDSDKQYANEIKDLLGPLVDIQQSTNSLYYVQLAHHSLRGVLCKDDTIIQDPALELFTFTSDEAHLMAAQTCMILCGKSTFAMANSFGVHLAFLLQYAWEHWSYHLKLSHDNLSTTKIHRCFNNMFLQICRDSLTFLCALAEFVSRPVSFNEETDSEIEHIVCFQRAQETLTKSIDQLNKVFQFDDLASGMKLLRQTFDDLKDRQFGEVGFKWAPWLRSKALAAKARFTETQTSVKNIKGRQFAESSTAGRLTIANGSTFLWQLAIDLRMTALSFAVNPIYTSLMKCSKDARFSPISVLVYTSALFEEIGNYPYWAFLPGKIDVMRPFITLTDDAQHGPARFVLHSMFPKQDSSKETTLVTHFKSQPFLTQPDSRLAADAYSVSASHKALVRRAHALTSQHYFGTAARLNAFQSNNAFEEEFIRKPLGNIYLQQNMYMYDTSSSWHASSDPVMTLGRYAPDAVREAPAREFLRSMPQIWSAAFASFIAEIFVRFGGFAKLGFGIQARQLETARQSLLAIWTIIGSTSSLDSFADLPHIALGILLYALRCLFFPQLGGMFIAVNFWELRYCFRHPAQFLEAAQSKSIWSWSFLFWVMKMWPHDYVLTLAEYNDIADLLSGLNYGRQIAWVRVPVQAYGHCIKAERAVYQCGFSLANAVATGMIIFASPERVTDLVLFSLSFWMQQLLGFLMAAGSLGVAQNGGLLMFFGAFMLQIVLLMGLGRVFKYFRLGHKIAWLFSPLTKVLDLGLRKVMDNFKQAFQICMMLCFVYIVYRTYWDVGGWLRDPFNLRGSLSQLHGAFKQARSNLKSGDIKRIGDYPFGGLLKDGPLKLSDVSKTRLKIESEHASTLRSTDVHPDAATGASPGRSSSQAAARAAAQSSSESSRPRPAPSPSPGRPKIAPRPVAPRPFPSSDSARISRETSPSAPATRVQRPRYTPQQLAELDHKATALEVPRRLDEGHSKTE